MNKEKYNQHLRIRLTEDQLKRLLQKLVTETEEKTRSEFIREIINEKTKQENGK